MSDPNEIMNRQSKMPKGQGFLNYFLTSFRVTLILIVGLAALGIWTILTLPRESTPEIKVPVAAVITVFPGASARDVEELVTTPIEDELINLTGLDRLSSSSRLGISSVTAEFNADEDLDEAFRRMREAVDNIQGLPSDVEDPTVIEVNFSNQPILSISLGGVEDDRLLSVLADELAAKLEDIAGVSGVDVAGKRDEEIRIVVDPGSLADRGVSMNQVVGAIRAANIDAPLGQLETEKYAYDLRLVGGFNHVGDVAGIPITLGDGQVVPLGVIADVQLLLTEQSSLSRVKVRGSDSSSSVTLSVRKKTGGNIIKIIEEVTARIEAAKTTFLPAEIEVVTFADQAEEIRSSLSNVTRSGVQTLIIVFGLLWLFLGWRAAFISAIAVPLTFAISFLVFDQTGTTLNNVSLFSLILSLGLLVDTTIVIVEGIFMEQSEHPDDDLTVGAAQVVSRFKKALIGGTLTTVAAFFPMLLVTGIIGEFLKVIPIVVAATLVSSLFVALAFIPAVTVQLLNRKRRQEKADPALQDRARWFDKIFNRWRGRYDSFIAWALESKRFQRLFIGGLVILLVAGLSLPFTGVLKTGLFPAVDIDFMFLNVELPPGSRLEQTDQVVHKIEDILADVPEVDSYVANIGSGVSLDIIGSSGSSSENLASFFVNLDKERDRSSLDISAELRETLKPITEAKIVVEEISAGPPTSAPVELRVIGEELAVLDELSQEIMDELALIDGAIDIDRNLRNSAGEFRFVFDRELLAAHGLTATQVAGILRTSVFGLEVTTFLDDAGDEISVKLEALEDTVDTVDDVLALPILTASGEEITVGQVAQVDLGTSIDAIRHRDGERAVSVSASVSQGANSNEITTELLDRIKERGLPEGYRIASGGEQQETEETFLQLYQSMSIAVVLILLILVVEFNSYRQPIIIFISIPLALIGVLFGLVLTGGQLNFAAFIGVVSLTGIVVNNAIILVDRMNAYREKGMEIVEAVKQAASSRLRPIILTTITTAAGVSPLIWVDEFFRDMALTLITGLLFSSILTLVLIPILYMRQAQKMERKGKKKIAPELQLSPVP